MEPKQNMAINKKQNEILTNFMSGHQDLARGVLKTAQGRKNSNLLWEKLTNSLNTEGPPQKDVKDWKKTWSDLKYKVKNKLRSNKLHLKGTGGGPYMQKNIDELEEKIIECAGLEAAVEGIPKAKSFGVRNQKFSGNNKEKDKNNEQERNYDILHDSPNVWEEIVQDIQNETENDENIPVEEPAVEHEGHSNQRRNKREKENYVKQYVVATETINSKLDTIYEMLYSSQKTQKRRLEVEEKQYRLKKKKFELYEKNEINRLRLQEAMLNTKLEKNRIRLRELDTQN